MIDDLYIYYAKEHPVLQKLLWDIEKTYMGLSVYHSGRQKAERVAVRYPPIFWNQYQNIIDGKPITNNAQEGFCLISLYCNQPLNKIIKGFCMRRKEAALFIPEARRAEVLIIKVSHFYEV